LVKSVKTLLRFVIVDKSVKSQWEIIDKDME
jgi:hypothetical protein